MGFYTWDKEKVKTIIEKMPKSLQDKYQDIFNDNNENGKPFPMAKIANKETRVYLRGTEWKGFLNLENQEHINGALIYLKDKMDKLYELP